MGFDIRAFNKVNGKIYMFGDAYKTYKICQLLPKQLTVLKGVKVFIPIEVRHFQSLILYEEMNMW